MGCRRVRLAPAGVPRVRISTFFPDMNRELSTEDLLAKLPRLMPHLQEAEEALLAGMLQEPARWLPECLATLKPDAFYLDVNRALYTEMIHLFVDEVPLDVVTLTSRLRELGALEKLGGPSRISELYTMGITPGMFAHYRELVEAKWLQRRLLHAAALTMEAVHSFEWSREKPALSLVIEAEGRLTELHPSSSRSGLQHISKILPAAVEEIQTAFERRGHITHGLATGFTDLDRCTMGIETGLCVLAARPSKGKTVAMLQWAMQMALGFGHYPEFDQPALPVGVWSLETETKRLARRMLCNLAEINLGRARDGLMSRAQLEAMQSEALKLAGSRLFLETCFGLTIQEFRVKVRQAVKRHGLRLVMVDYLQLLGSSSKAAQLSRTTMMAEVSNGLKALAHELDVPVVALAQINREGVKPRPSMADIKDSGQIEQDADYIFILCDAPDDGAAPIEDDGEAFKIDLAGDFHVGLDVVKLKEGRTTTDGPPIRLKFMREFFKMWSTTGKMFSNNAGKRQK